MNIPGKGRRAIKAILLALGLSVGLTIATVTPALANDHALSRIFNYTNETASCCSTPVGVGVNYHTSYGTWVYQVLSPGTWQGEVSYNNTYEPREFFVGPGWCVMYAYQFGGSRTADTWVCGGAGGVWQNIYVGDGNTTNYDTYLEKAFQRGY